jgi:hypothetical protein
MTVWRGYVGASKHGEEFREALKVICDGAIWVRGIAGVRPDQQAGAAVILFQIAIELVESVRRVHLEVGAIGGHGMILLNVAGLA